MIKFSLVAAIGILLIASFNLILPLINRSPTVNNASAESTELPEVPNAPAARALEKDAIEATLRPEASNAPALPAVENASIERPKQPAASSPAEPADSIPAHEAKAVARRAYEIVRSGDVLSKDFDKVVKQLEKFPQSTLDEKQKDIGTALLAGMKSLSSLGLRSDDPKKLEWSTSEDGGKNIESLEEELVKRKNDVKTAAGKIAVEYLAIGDLADKLQMTTQDFQKAMGEKEALVLSIKRLNAVAKTELSDNERDAINAVLRAVYSPNTGGLVGSNGVTPASESATAASGEIAADTAGDEEYLKAVNELVGEPHKRIAKSKDPVAAYATWAKQVWERKVQSRHLESVAGSIAGSTNIFDSENDLSRILALVDAVPAINDVVPAINDGEQKDWTPDQQVMRVRRVAARLHFWTMYAQAVAGEVLKSSGGDFGPANLPTMSSAEQRLKAAKIYQRIRVSLWPLVGGSEGEETPDNKQLSHGKTYQLKAVTQIVTSESTSPETPICNYTMPNPQSGQWVRFAIPPASRPKEGEQSAEGATASVASTKFEGEELENGDWHRWKMIEFNFDETKWQSKVGRPLERKKSYRLTAGGVFIAPAPNPSGTEEENTFSVAVPPRAVSKFPVANPLPGPVTSGDEEQTKTKPAEAKTLDLSVTIQGLPETESRLENDSSETWRVIRYVWKESKWIWVEFEGDAEANYFLSPPAEVQPAAADAGSDL